MPGTGPKDFLCITCGKRTKPDRRRFIAGPAYANYRKHFKVFSCKDNDVTCIKCYSQFYRKSKCQANRYEDNQEESENQLSESEDDYEPPAKKQQKTTSIKSPKIIQLPITSAGKSHSSCCVCKDRKSKFQTLSTENRHKAFLSTGHLLLSGARCCPTHIDSDGSLNEQAILHFKSLSSSSTTFFNKTELLALITDIRSIALKNENLRIDFDNKNTLKDSDFLNLTGITKENFEDLISHVKSIRQTKNRSIRTCIALFLVRLRTGMSYRMLSTLFNIGKTGIRRAIATARKELSINFTPKYLGFQHISRQDIKDNHTRPLAKELFGNEIENPVILVADGTYVYIQKSNNFKFQRRSYSLHKNRPLVKPMIIVSTTGYIVSVLGPYHADYKNNDANIIKHNFKLNMEQMTDWITEGDILILDRGFRDAVDFLEEMGVHSKMPSFLKKGQKQHTVEEANSSRLITKIRWVVESVNGRLKLWRYLANVVPNTQIPHIGDDIKLVAAICNKYKPPLNSGNQEEDQLLAAKMKMLASKGNALYERVVEEKLDRRIAAWKNMDSENVVEGFPTLSEEELTNITVGVYQLKLARSYTCEHLDEDGDYIIMLNDEIQDILRVKIQSRHTSSKLYLLWIEYGPAVIKGWYCQCKAGARVVGACAHVSSVLWYLGYARYADSVRSVKNWSMYLEDASNVPEEIEDSDSEASCPEE